MNAYRITLSANRSVGVAERRTFTIIRYRATPRAARDSLGNRAVIDPSDGAWFDEWRVTTTRKVTPPRCATVGCANRAAMVITWSLPGEREQKETEHVCADCGTGYLNRPALQARKVG